MEDQEHVQDAHGARDSQGINSLAECGTADAVQAGAGEITLTIGGECQLDHIKIGDTRVELDGMVVEPGSKKNVLDLNFAVFNGHINNANIRARKLLGAIAPNQLEEVERIEREGDGIMAIFQTPMTPATLMYSSMVCAFVNEEIHEPETLFSLEDMLDALRSSPQLRAVVAQKMRETGYGT
jgi:hypothetical protein